MGKGTAVLIVGVGGIGSALFQDLCRFLRHDIDIHLIDGDLVAGKNLQRQHFSRKDLGRNKAEALAERATIAIGLKRIYYHPQYLTKPRQIDRIARQYENVVIVGAVDNHPARRVMEAFVKAAGLSIYYVDCANGEHRGEIVAVAKEPGQGVTGDFRSDMDPSVLTDNTGDPTKASCTELLDSGNVQVLYTNRKAAILALELIDAYLRGDKKTGIVYFRDCVVSRLKAVIEDGPAQMADDPRAAVSV